MQRRPRGNESALRSTRSTFWLSRSFDSAFAGRYAHCRHALAGVRIRTPPPSLPVGGIPFVTVSFVIPLFNCLPLTQAMLASLRATVPEGMPHEIILVDDGSTDGTREWLQGPQGPAAASGATVRALLNESNQGFAKTCNRGAEAATGEFLFFLNNDLVLLPGWLEPMLEVFSTRPDAGVVGNVQRNAATGAIDHAGLAFNAKGKPEHLTGRGPGWIGSHRVIAVTGACFGIRTAAWRKLGGFDEQFVNGGEDVDLCLRALQAGLPTYVALRSVVRHHISASPGRKLRDEQNTERLVRRWHETIRQQIARPCARACLAASWEEPRNYADPQLARECLLYVCDLLPRPTRRIAAAVTGALALEMARWDELLRHVRPVPPRAIAPALFPIVPEDPPVL
jgi:GT2 family glycosyltransferase